jgi:hypothetical protein
MAQSSLSLSLCRPLWSSVPQSIYRIYFTKFKLSEPIDTESFQHSNTTTQSFELPEINVLTIGRKNWLFRTHLIENSWTSQNLNSISRLAISNNIIHPKFTSSKRTWRRKSLDMRTQNQFWMKIKPTWVLDRRNSDSAQRTRIRFGGKERTSTNQPTIK